ncbi:glycosyltransferase family 4 protein [Acidocella sp.]|uniref:glycosyltransferase family 4 protein n=1 Tax=Acidocella sp. TaxID=50710 RepID=UPI003D07F9A6
MIVFVTDELPRPDAAGHLALNYAILSWLRAEGHEVVILLTGMRLVSAVERYDLVRLTGPHILRVGPYVTPSSPIAAARTLARQMLRRLPAPFAARLHRRRNKADAVLGGFPSADDLRWCARAIARLRPHAVLIDTIFRAPLLSEPELAGRNSVLITHDLFYRRAEALRAAGYTVRPETLTRDREAKLLEQAGHIAAIQPEEAALLREMCPATDIFITPMPALPCPPPSQTRRIAGRLVFVGSDSLPNLDGLRWFFSEIWPELRGHGLTLDLIGDCGPALRRRLPPEIVVHGRVRNLAPLLHRAALAISPLRTGSGLKIKMLDYARHGLFTIATPPSLQGFDISPNAPFIMAGSAGMFALAILRHAAAPPPPEQALAYVISQYGVESAFASLKAALAPARGKRLTEA